MSVRAAASPRLPSAGERRLRAILGSAGLLALGGLLFGAAAWYRAFANPVGEIPPEGFEAMRSLAAYQTSESCLSCHPNRHESWRATFHSTMTQVASPASVEGDFHGKRIDWPDGHATPVRKGDQFFLETTHPLTGEETSFPIVRTVGSRRMQQYVAKIGDRHVRLPAAWSMEEGRWFHLAEAFFQDDATPFHANSAVWDVNCVFCHNVDPKPGFDEAARSSDFGADAAASNPQWRGTIDSSVAELGIACEACHGPGEEHARRMANPARRQAFHAKGIADPTIVNPLRLDKVRSVQVCGHCHGQRLPADRDAIDEIMREGDPYTAGEDLSKHFEPITNATKLDGKFFFADRFWRDGSPRLTAYEYQGILKSPCFERGEMTCLSCHAMHEGDPRGQLNPRLLGNAMCVQCHGEYASDEAARKHSFHDPAGSGGSCVACHMPPEVYGVMAWHPTHQIAAPNPARAALFNKPDACSTCHAGRSKAWAAEQVEKLWPNAKRPKTPERVLEKFQAPELARALFAGDAASRTHAAWRLGQPDPPELEAARLAVPLLAEIFATDAFPNVRRTARNALAALTGRADLPLPLDPLKARAAFRDALLAEPRWAGASAEAREAGWPLEASGALDRQRLEEWLNAREEVPFAFGE